MNLLPNSFQQMGKKSENGKNGKCFSRMAIVPVAGSIASWPFLRWPDQYQLPITQPTRYGRPESPVFRQQRSWGHNHEV